MTHKELIERCAMRLDEADILKGLTLQEVVKIILSEVYRALQEPTGEMIDTSTLGYPSDRRQIWREMIRVSPIADSREGKE